VLKVDVNADLGEVEDGGVIDSALLQVITSANVACGGHAGDAASMLRVCSLASHHGVALGAQVSYVDRAGFGRRRIDIDPATLRQHIHQQVTDLEAAARKAGTSVRYIKPHGALYHAAIDDTDVAQVLLEVASDTSLSLLTMPFGHLYEGAQLRGLSVFSEAFLDRGYATDGRLLPRDHPEALLKPDAALTRLRDWAESHTFTAQSLCIHSDSPGALELAHKARNLLRELSVTVVPFIETSRNTSP
jgi:UPF0271 protein